MATGIIEPQGPQDQERERQERERQQAQQSGLSRSKLVQKLQQLAAGGNLPPFIHELVYHQAVVVAGTEAVALKITPDAENKFSLETIDHIRPDDSTPEIRAAAIEAFQKIIRPMIERNMNGMVHIENPNDAAEPQWCLVTLLRSENAIVAATAVIARCRDQRAAEQRLASMELVAGYFDLFTLRHKAEQFREVAQRHQDVFQYGTAVATADGFDASAMNLCNELASRTGATRVSLGWVKGNEIGTTKVKLKAMSHTEQFDRKQEMSVLIEKVMEECLDQEEVVEFDPDGGSSPHVTRDAQQLSRINGGETIVSLPLRHKGEIQGVITLEFAREKKLLPNEATGLAVSVELLAPQLYDRYQNDRWLVTKAGISARETAKLIIGPKHMLAKLITALVLALLIFTIVYKPMYHVTPSFTFAATIKRSVSAPFEGVIEEVYVKPGDAVAQGDKLVKLRTRELVLQRNEAKTKADKARAEAAKYGYGSDPQKQADAQAALKEAAASDAEAAVLQDRIDRATIKAPIAGEVFSGGDLREKIGATVKLGDPLLDIGDPHKLRLELLVKENDIQEVKEGMTGQLATNALPTETFPFKVDTIVKEGKAKEGENLFLVYGTIEGPIDPAWRPGMQGEANINIEPRRIIWIYTHRVMDFIHLKLWKFW